MRAFRRPAACDAAICRYTSFGYFPAYSTTKLTVLLEECGFQQVVDRGDFDVSPYDRAGRKLEVARTDG